MIQAGGIPPVPAAEQAPLLIAKQGSFAVGGNILQRCFAREHMTTAREHMTTAVFPAGGKQLKPARVTMPTTPPWTSRYRPMPACFL